MLYVSPDRQIKCIISASVSVVFTMLHTSHSQLLPDAKVYFSFIIFLINYSRQDNNIAGLMSVIVNSVRLYEEAWKQANVLVN